MVCNETLDLSNNNVLNRRGFVVVKFLHIWDDNFIFVVRKETVNIWGDLLQEYYHVILVFYLRKLACIETRAD